MPDLQRMNEGGKEKRWLMYARTRAHRGSWRRGIIRGLSGVEEQVKGGRHLRVAGRDTALVGNGAKEWVIGGESSKHAGLRSGLRSGDK